MKSFLVTETTGDTGRHATALLLERGHHVRALIHRQDARSEALQKLRGTPRGGVPANR